MKKSLLYIAIVALIAFALSGCNFVFSLILDPDLTVENIEMTEDQNGDVIGLRITFANYGGGAEDVEYAIYLSYSEQVNPATDFLLYKSTFDVDWNSEEVITLSVENDIIPYMTANDLYAPNGQFHFGVFVDPDDRIDEGDETDNDGAYGPYDFGGGGTADLTQDNFEVDDDTGSAFYLDYVNDLPATQNRNFHYQGDVDYLEVYLLAGDTLYVETFSSGGLEGDTVLRLLNAGLTEVAYNDDTNGLYSVINFTAITEGTYFIEVSELSSNFAEYGLYVSQ